MQNKVMKLLNTIIDEKLVKIGNCQELQLTVCSCGHLMIDFKGAFSLIPNHDILISVVLVRMIVIGKQLEYDTSILYSDLFLSFQFATQLLYEC